MAEEEKDRGSRARRGPKLRKRRWDGWTRKDEQVFLTHLRATSNVNASARAAGKSPSSAFGLRARDPAFAAKWDAALAEARVRLHGKLIVFAETKGKEPEPRDDGEPAEPDMANFDPDLAFKLIKFNEGRLAGGRRGHPQPQPVSDEELTAVLIAQLDALRRRLAKKKI